MDTPRRAARPLTPDEPAEVNKALLADLEPTWSRPGWRYLKHFNGFATSFWLTPSDITTETVNDLWEPDTEATVVTIRLTTLGGRPRVSAWVRYHSDKRTPKGLPNGLNRLTGRHLAAVRASLPAPTTRALLVVPTRGLLEGDELVMPLAQAR